MYVVILLLLLLLPTAGWSLTADQDFTARCTAAGVTFCTGLNVLATDVTPFTSPDGGGTTRADVDTSVKTSGAGSLRFSLPPPPTHAGQNIGGQWLHSFNDAFGQNETFYAQFRMRLSESMLATTWDTNSGWKFAMLTRDDSVCGNLALVWKTYQNSLDYTRTFPIGYTECGARGLYTNNGVPPTLLQQKGTEVGYNCSYGNINETDCFYFKPNEWMTFYFKVQLGTFGDANSTIEAWVAREGATTWSKWIHLPNFVINTDGQGASAAINTIVLLPYMTGLDITTGAANKWSYMWFDEVIISTSPIAIPSANLVATNLPATLGWHSLSNTALWNGPVEYCACEDGYPEVCGASNCKGPFAYSGGIFDTSRTKLLTYGGGHNDYYGNEQYVWNLAANPPTVGRLTNPTLPIAPGECEDPTVDCADDGTHGCMITNGTGSTPNSRHTGDSIQYDIANDALISIGGNLACVIGYGGLPEPAGDMWKFSYATNMWSRLTLDGTGDNPFNYFSGSEVYHASDLMGYDNVNNCGYYHNRYRLYTFKVTGTSIKFDQLSTTTLSLQASYLSAGVLDPTARRFYLIGNSEFTYYDISGVAADCSYGGAALTEQPLSLTLAPSADPTMSKAGFQYYAPLNALLAWVGNDIMQYDVAHDHWQKLRVGVNTVSPPSEHNLLVGGITFGRFQCDEDIGGCVLAYYPANNIYYIRLGAYGTAEEITPPPDPTPTLPGLRGAGGWSGRVFIQ